MIECNNRSFIKLYNEIQKVTFGKDIAIDSAELLKNNYGRFNLLYDIDGKELYNKTLHNHIKAAQDDMIYFFREMAKIPQLYFDYSRDNTDINDLVYKGLGAFVEPNFNISRFTFEKINMIKSRINPIVKYTDEYIKFGILLSIYYFFIQKHIVIINTDSDIFNNGIFKKFIEVNDLIVSTRVDLSNIFISNNSTPHSLTNSNFTIYDLDRTQVKDVFIFNYRTSDTVDDLVLTLLYNERWSECIIPDTIKYFTITGYEYNYDNNTISDEFILKSLMSTYKNDELVLPDFYKNMIYYTEYYNDCTTNKKHCYFYM